MKTHPELGNIDLVLKVSQEQQDKSDIGIRILSNSTWQNKPYVVQRARICQIIFGR